MALIRNPDLRTELLAYYRFLEDRDYTYDLMSTAYRDAVRARMDPDLQLLIRRECAGHRESCRLDLTGWALGEHAEWLSSNETLADGLRRVIVQWTRGEEEYLPEALELTQALETRIRFELDN